jgi:nucleoside-diphosphate-sugar epimerase
MRVLVAGGGGFLGSHLVDALVHQGCQVTIVDNFITGQRKNVAHFGSNALVEVVEGDVTQLETLRALPHRFERIYHLASPASPVEYARYPIETLLVNSTGTLLLLQRAEQDGARFLITSTSEIYGEPQVHPQREDYWGNVNTLGPRACYDEGKRYAESLTIHFSQERDVDVRIARLFNTYGPRIRRNDGRVVPNFIVQALRGRPLTVYGDGLQTRSLCYVADTVAGLVRMMEGEGLCREVFNIGNPDEYTMLQLAEEISRAVGTPLLIEYRPMPVDDPTRRRPDISKALRLLGWEPTWTLADGLARTVAALHQELEQDFIPESVDLAQGVMTGP